MPDSTISAATLVTLSGTESIPLAQAGAKGRTTPNALKAFSFTRVFTTGIEAYRASDNGVVIGNNAGLEDVSDAVLIGFFSGAGQAAGSGVPFGAARVSIGRHAGYSMRGDNAIAVGHAAGQYAGVSAGGGDNAVILGPYAARNTTQYSPHYVFSSVIIGANAGENGRSQQYSVLVGANAGKGLQNGVETVAIGGGAASALTTGTGGVFIGADAGATATGASNCVFLGYQAGKAAARSNTLIIDANSTYSQSETTAFLYGEFDNRVFAVRGKLIVTDTTATAAAAPTIASASTIAPTKSISFVSGTTTISTITPPSPISTGGGQITLIPTGLWSTNTAGNIALATTGVVSKALILTYDATTAKWYPSY